MAADSNKKSVSGDQETTPTPQVGGGGQAASRRKLSIRGVNGKKLLVVSLAIVVIVLGWVLLTGKVHVGKKVYAESAGHKIYKQDVKALIHNHKGISDHQAAKVLADKYLAEALAKEEKITVTSKDIEAVNGPDAGKLKSTDPYSYQLGVNQLYFDKLQAYNRGIYKGELLVAHFSRFVETRPEPNRNAAAFPQFGNPKAIAADKKYAKGFITNLYDRIKSGEMTWDQAIQAERNDPNLGEQGYPALSHSGPFDTSKLPEPLFVATSAINQVRKIKPGQTSKPFVVKVGTSDGSELVESYFLVVRMDSATGGQSADFDEYLTQAMERLGYEVYV